MTVIQSVVESLSTPFADLQVSSDFKGVVMARGGTGASDSTTTSTLQDSQGRQQGAYNPGIAIAGLTVDTPATSEGNKDAAARRANFQFSSSSGSTYNFVGDAASSLHIPIEAVIALLCASIIAFLVAMFFLARYMRNRYLKGKRNSKYDNLDFGDNYSQKSSGDSHASRYAPSQVDSENPFYGSSSPRSPAKMEEEKNHQLYSVISPSNSSRPASSADSSRPSSYMVYLRGDNPTSDSYEKSLSILSDSSIGSSSLQSLPSYIANGKYEKQLSLLSESSIASSNLPVMPRFKSLPKSFVGPSGLGRFQTNAFSSDEEDSCSSSAGARASTTASSVWNIRTLNRTSSLDNTDPYSSCYFEQTPLDVDISELKYSE